MSNKNAGTLQSRQNHFIKFIKKIKLGNNVALKGYTLLVRNLIMSCYAADLAAGENLVCKTIKAKTIKKYLAAAAELSIQSQMMNPTLNLMGKESKLIGDVLHELKRWEKMSNRREPVTTEMIEFIVTKGKTYKDQDNIYSSMGDWLIIGEQAGCRRLEWAQECSHLNKYKTYQRNIDGTSTAFILDDFEFRGSNNVRIDNHNDEEVMNSETVHLKWRYQKNLDNGQVIQYLRDKEHSKHCFVKAAIRIRNRAIRLSIAKGNSVSVFKHKGKAVYINDKHICSLLQEAAKKVHGITCKEDLARFTTHSIRVGACVKLHESGIDAETIKIRLRWKSDAFRAYLRNVIAIAKKHRDILRSQ